MTRTDRPKRATWRPRRGATLVESVVVIALTAVLLSLGAAAVQKVRAAAARAACAARLGQLAVAAQHHAADRAAFPQGCGYPYRTSPGTGDPAGLSWQTALLPYGEQSALFARVDAAHRASPTGEAIDHFAILELVVPLFLCPSERNTTGAYVGGLIPRGLHSYLGVAGSNLHRDDGIMHPGLTVRPGDISDGSSNTVMIGERPPRTDGMTGGWYANWGSSTCPISQIMAAGSAAAVPAYAVGCTGERGTLHPGSDDAGCSAGHFWSRHPGGAHFAFADGSVRFLRYSAADVLPALATRAGGESVTVPD